MQFEKQLSGGRSPLAPARREDGSSRYSIYVAVDNGDSARWSPTENDRPWRSAFAAGFGLVVNAVAGVAACAEAGVPNFLFAVLSWTFAQFLAGCAAYAQAMYPVFGEPGEPADRPHLADEFKMRALDHRALKDIGVCRRGGKYFAGREDCSE